jgi:hypothetical protein
MSQSGYCPMCDSYHFNTESFYDKDLDQSIYFCSNKCKNEYANKKANPNFKSRQDIENDRMREEQQERLAASKAKRDAIARDIENGNYSDNSSSGKSASAIRAEMEADKQRAEQEAKEAAARKQRADQLRREGKNFQAFLVEFQNGIIAVVSVIFLVGLGAYFMIDGENQKQNAVQINADLEKIEDSVRIYINEKNFDRSLVLANQLNHPLHEVYEGKGTMWESEFYDLYWNKKREEYKEIILNKGSLSEDNSKEKKESSKSKKKKSSKQEEEVNETSDEINTDEEKSATNEELDPEYQ